MLKKILIGIAVLVVLIVAGLAYLNHRNRTLSPPGHTELTNGPLTVTVDYSRPSVRGRLIFGAEEEGALQPYGQYWRLGANEATELTVNQDVLFNGKTLKAGTYSLYAVPQEKEIVIGLNTETGRWGAGEPDYSMDLFQTPVPYTFTENVVEQFTVKAESVEGGIDLVFAWANRQWKIVLNPA